MVMANLPSNYFGKIKDGDAILAQALRNDPITVSQDIRDLFLCTCFTSNSNFNTHPVMLMAVNFMQKQENYTWTYQITSFTTGSKAARDILFPGLNTSTSPSNLSIDGLGAGPFKDGGVALTVKAFYNGMQDYKDNINSDKFGSGIANLNTYINNNISALFAEYYRWNCIKSAPSPDLVSQYLSLLLSAPYRQMKLAEFTDGGWINPQLEMYNHLVKLKACGATDDQVSNAIYQLTQTAPAIPMGAMSGLTAQTWKSYRGWLFSGYLDWGDIHAQNLGEARVWVPMPPPGGMSWPITSYFCEYYLRTYGYWKDKSSSCFAPGAKVVLAADGPGTAKTATKPIEKIVAGDVVQSRRFGSSSGAPPEKATVAFVSRVARAGRKMYSLPEAPDVAFTATHPLVRRNAEDKNASVAPELGFVSMDDACSLNPTWHSIPTRVLHEATEAPAKDEVLYDLVLEGSAEPISYLLQSDKTGQIVEALSEAPHTAWFPHAICFLSGMLTGCCDTNQHPDAEAALAAFLKALENDELRLAVLLQAAAREARQKLLVPSKSGMVAATHMAMPPEITLDTLLDVGRDSNTQSNAVTPARQLRADVLERCVGKLGRLINDYIHLGWVDPAPNPAQVQPYLLVHTLTYLGTGTDTNAQAPKHRRLRLVVKGAAAAAAEGDPKGGPVVADVELPVEREGWLTFEVQRALPLRLPFRLPPPVKLPAAGGTNSPKIKRTDSPSPETPAPKPQSRSLDLMLEFEDPDAVGEKPPRPAVVLFGGGPLVEQVPSIVGLGARGDAEGVHAVVQVQWCLMSPVEVEKWQGKRGWTEDVKMGYADGLGREFAAQIAEASADAKVSAGAKASAGVKAAK